jgi:phage shock protein A
MRTGLHNLYSDQTSGFQSDLRVGDFAAFDFARLARAESTDRINRALDRSSGQSAFAEFSRLERRVDRAEALSEAADRLDGRDPDADELAAKFAAEEHRTRLEDELDALRQRVATSE